MSENTLKGEAVHDAYAITSLILSLLWLFGLGAVLGILLGFASNGAAYRNNRRTSLLAVWGIVLGFIGLGGAIMLWAVIAGAMHASQVQDCINTVVNGIATCTPTGG